MATAKTAKKPAVKSAASTPTRPRRIKPPPSDAVTLMDVSQIANALTCSERYVYSLIASGKFPAADASVGSSPRWRTSTYNDYARNLKPPEKD